MKSLQQRASRAFDRPALRALALFLTVGALLGWDWGYSYRSGLVDTWELPILSALLAIVAALPSQFRTKRVAIALATIGISTFAWWATERAEMLYGQYDVGGIAARLVAYGIVVALSLPKRSSPNPSG